MRKKTDGRAGGRSYLKCAVSGVLMLYSVLIVLLGICAMLVSREVIGEPMMVTAASAACCVSGAAGGLLGGKMHASKAIPMGLTVGGAAALVSIFALAVSPEGACASGVIPAAALLFGGCIGGAMSTKRKKRRRA